MGANRCFQVRVERSAGLGLFLAALIMLTLPACGAAGGGETADMPTPVPLAPEESVDYADCPQRVLIMSADGLRPDALSPERTPNIYRLAASGSYTWTARTINPPSTLPSHASMLTGYEVRQHGLSWNDYYPEMGYIRTPSIFTIAHESGLRTAMFFANEKMQHIALPGSVDDVFIVPGDYGAVVREAVEYLDDGFGVMFVHLRRPDKAGHTYGWMSEQYLAVIPDVDEDVRLLMEALRQAGLEETTLVIFTADHGGHGTNHMSALASDMNIPWIIAGPGVVPGQPLTTEVRIYDTAATAAWALGLPLPEDMLGQPVQEAFTVEVGALCELAAVP